MIMVPEIVELTEGDVFEICVMVAEPNHEREIMLAFSVYPTSSFAGKQLRNYPLATI